MSSEKGLRGLCVLAVIAAAVLGGCGSDEGRKSRAGGSGCSGAPSGARAVTLRYRVESTPERPGSFDDAKKALCARLKRLGLRRVSVVAHGPELDIRADRIEEGAARAGAMSGVLTFFDWDANVSGSRGPDVPFSGRTALFDAVQAASQMTPRVEPTDLLPGAATGLEEADLANDTPAVERHYLFSGERRLLAGPAWSRGALAVARGATSEGARILTVPRGLLVVEADRGDQRARAPRYFVLEDDAELSPGDAAQPTAGVDQATREPIVKLSLSEHGRTAFAALTRRIAQRSAQDVAGAGASGAEALERVAISLDDRVVSLVTIDPRETPLGIDGGTGVQIGGLRTSEEARRLALLLADKPFPAHLVPLTPER